MFHVSENLVNKNSVQIQLLYWNTEYFILPEKLLFPTKSEHHSWMVALSPLTVHKGKGMAEDQNVEEQACIF